MKQGNTYTESESMGDSKVGYVLRPEGLKMGREADLSSSVKGNDDSGETRNEKT